MTRKYHSIRFSITCRGRKVAHYHSRRQFRWFPMSLADAELAVATGNVREVLNGPDYMRADAEVVSRVERNGVVFITSAYTA